MEVGEEYVNRKKDVDDIRSQYPLDIEVVSIVNKQRRREQTKPNQSISFSLFLYKYDGKLFFSI